MPEIEKKNVDHKRFSRIDSKMIKKLLNLPKPIGRKIFERINHKLYLEKENILKQAFEQKLFTKKEYNEGYKDMFYDDYGSDSFVQYINAMMNAKVDVFVTLNERMLKRKEELKKRFGLKISNPEEIMKKQKETKKGEIALKKKNN